MQHMISRQRLRARLMDGPVIAAPGIYDAYGARLVEEVGFEAAYLTGNGVAACLLGQPDVGLVDLTLMVEHAHRVAACIEIPLICDADTGYGNAVNVRHTVREFESAGAAAIHLEDQQTPKRCGNLPGSRPVVPLEEHVGKIRAAVATRRDPDFIIIARTDAAAGHGIDEAIRRGRAYREAGADAVFIELKDGPNVIAELTRIPREVNAPCLINVVEGGGVAALTLADIGQIGFRVAIYPGLGRYAAGFAVREALEVLKQDGNTGRLRNRMLSASEYNKTLKLTDVEEWERRYLPFG